MKHVGNKVSKIIETVLITTGMTMRMCKQSHLLSVAIYCQAEHTCEQPGIDHPCGSCRIIFMIANSTARS